jgi:hypothetical protein
VVDARIPEQDIRDRAIARLSTQARHDYWSLTVLSVSMRTDGVIEPPDLRMLPWAIAAESIAELERAGLIEQTPGRVILLRFAATQTKASELDRLAAVREHERVRKARSRAKASGMSEAELERLFPTPPALVPGHVPDGSGETQRTEPEQEPGIGRPGVTGVAAAITTDWPTAPIPTDEPPPAEPSPSDDVPW